MRYFRSLIPHFMKKKIVKKISYLFFSYKKFLKIFPKPIPLRHWLTFPKNKTCIILEGRKIVLY